MSIKKSTPHAADHNSRFRGRTGVLIQCHQPLRKHHPTCLKFSPRYVFVSLQWRLGSTSLRSRCQVWVLVAWKRMYFGKFDVWATHQVDIYGGHHETLCVQITGATASSFSSRGCKTTHMDLLKLELFCVKRRSRYVTYLHLSCSNITTLQTRTSQMLHLSTGR